MTIPFAEMEKTVERAYLLLLKSWGWLQLPSKDCGGKEEKGAQV